MSASSDCTRMEAVLDEMEDHGYIADAEAWVWAWEDADPADRRVVLEGALVELRAMRKAYR